MRSRFKGVVTACVVAVLAATAVAHESLPVSATRQVTPPAPGAPLVAPPPVAAKFKVVVSDPSAGPQRKSRQQEWYFYRDANRIAVIKGSVEDIWLRDARGAVRFERVLHDDQRVIEYSAGELITLGVAAEWNALATFVDARELARMKQSGRTSHGAAQKLHFSAAVGEERLSVEWLAALQLPALVTRQSKGKPSLRYELLASSEQPQAGWPLPGARSADYLRIDAADFGDMESDPVVRKAEAIDIRAGWRGAHAHD